MAGFDFDPIGNLDPLARLNRLPGFGGGGQQRAAYRKPLPDAEAQSFGKQALNVGASGLNYALGTLDKPGQVVRGVLAGHGAAALKHLVPFSDSAGLTTEADHVSGRDLTNQYGLTKSYDRGWGAWGKGLAADVLTDPLTYASFGAHHALTDTGRAIQKTGALKGLTGRQMLKGFDGVSSAFGNASDLTHALDQGRKIASPAAEAAGAVAGKPLAGLARIGIPFGGPGVTFGSGKFAQGVAGAADAAGDWLKFGNPVGRAVGSLFDSTRHGAVSKIGQRGASQYMEPALQSLKADARADRGRVIAGLDPLVSNGAFPEREITDATRAVAEGVPNSFDPILQTQVMPVAGDINQINARRLAEAWHEGAPLNDVSDQYAKGYVHRSAFPESPQSLQLGGKGNRKLLPVTSGSNVGRDPVFRDIPGGTARLNDWFDRHAGEKAATTLPTIRQDLEYDFVRGGGVMDPAHAQAFDDKAAALAARLQAANPKYRTVAATATDPAVPGQPFFSPDLVADETQRGAQHAKTVSNARTAIGILSDNARQITPGDGMIPLPQAMRKLGLVTRMADPVTGTPMEGALVQMYRGLAKQGAGKVDPFLHGKTGALRKQVAQYGITPEHLGQLVADHAKWAAPEEIKSSLGAIDSVTNAFKALAYPIWPASHVRNAATAGLNNARYGTGIGDYLDQLQIMTGRGTRDLSHLAGGAKGLTTADQIAAARAAQYQNANIFGGHGMNEEIAGNVRDAFENGQRYTPNVPGSDRAGPHGNLAADTADLVLNQGLAGSLGATGKALGGSLAGLFNPGRRWGQSFGENLGVRGVGGAAKDVNPAVKAGRIGGTNIEDFFRGALYNSQVRQGVAPELARDAINTVHFDYDALAGFEKNVMRRVMPFYTFARKNLPLQVDTALHSPGIIQAQHKPFNQEGPGSGGYVPKHLQGGVSIPIGQEQDGKQQFISKLGLPAEEAFERLHFKHGLPDVKATALDYLGQTNPLIKGPLEQLFDTQFHSQRRLSDLRPSATASWLGRQINDDNPQWLSQVLANSPATRFISTAEKLGDPRKSWLQKGLNLGTGVRVTDVDTEKSRAIELRDAVQEMMKGHPRLSQYQTFYVKPDDAANLTPEEIEMMRMYSGIQDQAREYAKQKRIGIKP